jgi:RNA polymerase sigma factor (sigma-70 family)
MSSVETSEAVGVAPARVIHPAENAPESSAAAPSVNWIELVERIKANESAGLEELYGIFSKGVRFYFCRQLGPQDLEDKVHDSFLIVVSAVRRGELREPERLMGFVRTIIRRQVAAYIDQVVHSRKQQAELDSGRAVADLKRNPEQVAIEQQQEATAKKVLQGISRRDREILTRFYLLEETQDQICAGMNLSETQFRLLKSRAKARFGDLGRRKLARRRKLHFF